MPLEIIRNDITKMQVDAIVNAANHSLLGGGGVDGAIHRAAGIRLKLQCKLLGGCKTGEAKITKGYNLSCKYVIHTVGPVWQDGLHGEPLLLADCYRSSLELAEKYQCQSIAFPLISSGAYGYPKDLALRIAADTIKEFLQDHDMMVSLVVYDRDSFAISQRLQAGIRAFINDAYVGPDYAERDYRRRAQQSNFPIRPNAAKPQPSHSIDAESRPFQESILFDAAICPEEVYESAPMPMDAPGNLDDFLAQIDESFRDMLFRKIDERNMTDAECYKGANIDRKLFNKIKNQPDYKPGKSTVLALAISLRLPLEETREMLTKAGFSLSHSSKFDLIVEYFIRQRNYDIFQINEALFAFDQKLLGSVM